MNVSIVRLRQSAAAQRAFIIHEKWIYILRQQQERKAARILIERKY